MGVITQINTYTHAYTYTPNWTILTLATSHSTSVTTCFWYAVGQLWKRIEQYLGWYLLCSMIAIYITFRAVNAWAATQRNWYYFHECFSWLHTAVLTNRTQQQSQGSHFLINAFLLTTTYLISYYIWQFLHIVTSDNFCIRESRLEISYIWSDDVGFNKAWPP